MNLDQNLTGPRRRSLGFDDPHRIDAAVRSVLNLPHMGYCHNERQLSFDTVAAWDSRCTYEARSIIFEPFGPSAPAYRFDRAAPGRQCAAVAAEARRHGPARWARPPACRRACVDWIPRSPSL